MGLRISVRLLLCGAALVGAAAAQESAPSRPASAPAGVRAEIRRLLVAAQAAEREGDPARGRALAEEAVRLAEEEVDPRLSAQAHWVAASTAYADGDAAAALASYRTALAAWNEVPAVDPRVLADGRHNVALCERRLGRPAEALVSVDDALARKRALFAAEPTRLRTSLILAADVLVDLGRPDEALSRLAEARSAEDDAPAAAAILRAKARAHRAQGDVARADQAAAAAVARLIAAPARHAAALVEAAMERATLLKGTGSPAEALACLDDAAGALRGAGLEPPTSVDVLRAACLRRLGRYDDAATTADAAASRIVGDRRTDVAARLRAEIVAASSTALAGREEEAVRRLRAVVAAAEAATPPLETERDAATGDLAACLHRLGRPAEALPLYEAAVAAARRADPRDDGALAVRLGNVGGCLRLLGRPRDAATAYAEALDLATRTRSSERAVLAVKFARLKLDALDDPAGAKALLGDAIAEIEELRRRATGLDPFDRGLYFAELGRFDPYDLAAWAEVRTGDPEAALRFVERGHARALLDLAESSRVDPLREALRSAEEAGDVDGAARAAAARDAVAAAEAALLRAGADRVADAARRDLSAEDRARRAVEASSRVADAQADVRAAIRRRSDVLRNLLPESAARDPDEFRRGLRADERALVYATGVRGTLLFVVPPAGLPTTVRRLTTADGGPLVAEKLAAEVDAYLRATGGALEDGAKRGVDDPAATSASSVATTLAAGLFARLLPADVWSEIRGLRRVAVVAHGPLRRLPLEALVVAAGADAASTRYVLDDGPTFSYGASLSVLSWARRRRAEQRSERPTVDLVALGDPIFAGAPASRATTGPTTRPLERGAQAFAALPGTRREIAALTAAADKADPALFGRRPVVVALLGADATERRLFAEAPRARFLHLATHHVVERAGDPLFDRLALAAPAAPTPDDDGALTLFDLLERWRRRLARCEMVVLSACESNVGRSVGSEGTFAVAWGLHYAGAPCVVASLRPVEDEASADLMTAFYERLFAGSEKTAALAAAKRAVRARRGDPRFWAHFLIWGDAD